MLSPKTEITSEPRFDADRYARMVERCTAAAVDPRLETGAQLFESTMIAPGVVNAFVCDLCRKITVAVVRDPGYAPFMLPCSNPIHGPEPEPVGELSPRKLKRLANTKDGTFTHRDLKRMPDGRPIALRSVSYRTAGLFKESDATIELYRPTFAEYAALPDGSTARHIENGGLWFRDVGTQAGDQLTALAETEKNENEK
jgi:hypothetical protein